MWSHFWVTKSSLVTFTIHSVNALRSFILGSLVSGYLLSYASPHLVSKLSAVLNKAKSLPLFNISQHCIFELSNPGIPSKPNTLSVDLSLLKLYLPIKIRSSFLVFL